MRNAEVMTIAREVMKRDRNVLRELVRELSIRTPDHFCTRPTRPERPRRGATGHVTAAVSSRRKLPEARDIYREYSGYTTEIRLASSSYRKATESFSALAHIS
jgi:hypothetical protein